jgi:hypothetical protein
MPRWQRVYATVCAGAIAYALAYVLVDYAKIPRPIYEPLAHRFSLGTRPSGAVMGYLGLWLYALGAGALVAGLTWLLVSRRGAPIGGRTAGLLAAWTGTAWLLAAGYYAWNNWP